MSVTVSILYERQLRLRSQVSYPSSQAVLELTQNFLNSGSFLLITLFSTSK